MTPAPSGSVTFLFTDIEGSTRLWENHPGEMQAALERHDQTVRACVEQHRGYIFSTAGDAFCVAFEDPVDSLGTALDVQQALQDQSWEVPGGIRVRIGIHTGAADQRDGDYFGPALNRAARMMSIGHGGQVLVSSATAERLAGRLDQIDLEELGQYRLKDLARPETVWQAIAPGLQRDFPPLRSPAAASGNLPAPSSELIGRTDDLAGIHERLTTGRILTIVGPAGVGKTRLAIEVAGQMRPDFGRGVWIVDLTRIRDGFLVPQTVAALFGARTLPGLSLDESLAEFLRRDDLLLLLDNCEHVLSQASALAELLLSQCPGVRMLATSRQPLGAPGEIRWMLRPLQVGDAGSPGDAVQLFEARAQLAQRGFEVNAQNREAVIRLCRRLDGLPLAVELAAARLGSLTPSALLDRIDRRFALLANPHEGDATHHHTLAAAIEWSHDLLIEIERVAFRRCAAFAGQFDLDAAEAVIAGAGMAEVDVTAAFLALVDKSLVELGESQDGPRYRLLESIREYATVRLQSAGEEEAVQRRHAEVFALRAGSIGAGIASPSGLRWHRQLDADLADITAAVRWAVHHGDEGSAISLVAPLAAGVPALRTDQTVFAEEVLAMSDLDHATPRLDEVLAVAFYDCYLNSNLPAADELEVRFSSVLNESSSPPCSMARALLHAMKGDVAGAIRLNQACAAAATTRGDDVWIGAALTGLAACEWFLSDPRTLDHAEQAVAHLESCGSPTWVSAALLQLARARLLMGGSDVRAVLERAVDVAGDFAYVLPVPYAHAHLGELDLQAGDHARGLDHFREAIVGLYRARDVADLGFCLAQFAGALLPSADLDDVIILYEGVKHLAPHWLALPANATMVASLSAAERTVSPPRLRALEAVAARWQVDELVDHALALCDRG